MINDLKEYQQLAARTCPDLGEPYDMFDNNASILLSTKLNLSHMVMGMCSELSEIYDARKKKDLVNVSEEYADVMWYVANYCNIRGYSLESILNDGEMFERYSYSIFELTDLVKKYAAYNKAIDTTSEIKHLVNIVKNIIGEFDNNILGVSFYQALTNNIDKLKVRFPNKFNDADAITRDLDAERKELEK